MRIAYALTVLAMPAVGVFVAGPVRSGGAPRVPQATASAVPLVAPAFHPRLGERRWDIAQVASLGAAFGRVRP